jgi:hypothetical protein
MTASAQPIDTDIPGHNRPPADPVQEARIAWSAATAFLESAPAILDADSASAMKLFVDRTRKTIKDVEAAQKAKSKPLHDAWKKALAEFAPAIAGLTKVCTELTGRLRVYALAEEARRAAEAEAARAAAAEAERIAREAEAKERELLEQGEAVDPVVADEAFAAFEAASRVAAVAQRETHVKISGGDAPALSLRTYKTLVLTDVTAALLALGVTDKIREAILSSARDYRTRFGQLPFGVIEEENRRVV